MIYVAYDTSGFHVGQVRPGRAYLVAIRSDDGVLATAIIAEGQGPVEEVPWAPPAHSTEKRLRALAHKKGFVYVPYDLVVGEAKEFAVVLKTPNGEYRARLTGASWGKEIDLLFDEPSPTPPWAEWDWYEYTFLPRGGFHVAGEVSGRPRRVRGVWHIEGVS